MERNEENYAFIDSQNLNLGVRGAGWKLDFGRFRIYLKEKHGVGKAFLFIGYVRENIGLYARLGKEGYVCVFKPTLGGNGVTKGNYKKAVIVTGDGDFHCLVDHLISEEKLRTVIIPNQLKFSALLKMQYIRPYLTYMNDLRKKLEYKEKAP